MDLVVHPDGNCCRKSLVLWKKTPLGQNCSLTFYRTIAFQWIVVFGLFWIKKSFVGVAGHSYSLGFNPKDPLLVSTCRSKGFFYVVSLLGLGKLCHSIKRGYSLLKLVVRFRDTLRKIRNNPIYAHLVHQINIIRIVYGPRINFKPRLLHFSNVVRIEAFVIWINRYRT